MKIVITGGAGFIGIMLARRLLREAEIAGPDGRPAKIDELELFDMMVPAERPAGLDDRVKFTAGEIPEAMAEINEGRVKAAQAEKAARETAG